MCDDARDAELLVGALERLLDRSSRRHKSVRESPSGGAKAAEVDEELLAPEKPFGFLAASVTELARAARGV